MKLVGAKLYIQKIHTLAASGRKGMRTKQVAEKQNKVKILLNMSGIPPKVKAAMMEVFLPTKMRPRHASKVDTVPRQLEIIQRVWRSYCWKGLEEGKFIHVAYAFSFACLCS